MRYNVKQIWRNKDGKVCSKRVYNCHSYETAIRKLASCFNRHPDDVLGRSLFVIKQGSKVLACSDALVKRPAIQPLAVVRGVAG